MFKKEVMTRFYEYDSAPTFQVEEEIKKAYFVFIKDFCTCVSSYWTNYLDVVRVKHNATFDQNLTPSDEVYAFWWLSFNLDNEVKLFEKEEKEIVTKKQRGPHQSIDYQDDYARMYINLEKHRENSVAWKYWQSIFFDHYLHDLKTESVNRAVNERKHQIQIPCPSGYGLSRQKTDEKDEQEKLKYPSGEV